MISSRQRAQAHHKAQFTVGMVINTSLIDAYIAKKGLTPRLTDSDWESILQQVSALFGQELWHRCRLIHQAEDTWRRHSSSFPDGVPQPYHYIHHLEFVAFDSPQLKGFEQWLTNRGIVWRELRELDPKTENEEIVGLRIFGFDPDHNA